MLTKKLSFRISLQIAIFSNIQSGKAVGISSSDLLPGYRHHYQLGKEALSSGMAGWYYSGKMPLGRKLNWGLQALIEAGVKEQVSFKCLRYISSIFK